MGRQPPQRPPETAGSGVTLAEKVAFLARRDTYPAATGPVVAHETHMSWVFLAGERAYKLKKPIRNAFWDRRPLAVRAFLCREELRLNRRLAPEVYLGLLELRADAAGRLSLDGDGRTVDHLVVMQRLAPEQMLDAAVAGGTVTAAQVAGVAERLGAFYRGRPPARRSAPAYRAQFAREHERNRAVLEDPRFDLPRRTVAAVLARLDEAIADPTGQLGARARQGWVVDGHGDLRPEHVYLREPPVVIDCLEFSRSLRLVDPFDELAFLGMECEQLGAPWIGAALVERCAEALGERPPEPLLAFYTAYRACLRARLSLAHLLDAEPREPERWQPLARRYLALAEAACARLAPRGDR